MSLVWSANAINWHTPVPPLALTELEAPRPAVCRGRSGERD
jgi:hypothetical protein